jgi:hypothetical protein
LVVVVDQWRELAGVGGVDLVARLGWVDGRQYVGWFGKGRRPTGGISSRGGVVTSYWCCFHI